MKLTWIDLNSWIFQIAGQTILVDPWLVDPLVFYGLPWLFTAYHATSPTFTPETLPPLDLILISQAVDDHCHKRTLEKLDRSVPVIASPIAAPIVKGLGYHQVISLAHWQQYNIGDLQITAIPGATIQPGQVENGYLLQDQTLQQTLYYEPHEFPDQSEIVQRLGWVDVAIAPVIGQVLPLLGQVIMGPEQALDLVKKVKPRIFLPTTLGEIRSSGLLPKLIKSVGSLEEFRDRLLASHLPTEFVIPRPGESLDVSQKLTSAVQGGRI